MKETTIQTFNGSAITFENEDGTVMVNMTEVAKAFPGKNLSKIINSKEIQEYCEALRRKHESEITIVSSPLIITNRGNYADGSEQGTWVHQKVALRVAQKLSPEFSLWVDDQIERLLTQGRTEINYGGFDVPKTRAEALQLAADQARQIESLTEDKSALERQVARKDEQIAEQAKTIERQSKDVEYVRDILDTKDDYTFTQIAKEMGMRSANALLRKLMAGGFIFKQSGQYLPMARYADQGYFATRTFQLVFCDMTNGQSVYTVVTERGRRWMHDLHKAGKI